MKLIKLNESQYKRLFEDIEFYGEENPSSIPDEQTHDQTWVTSTMDKGDEGKEKGIPPGVLGKDPHNDFSPNDRYGTFRNAR